MAHHFNSQFAGRTDIFLHSRGGVASRDATDFILKTLIERKRFSRVFYFSHNVLGFVIFEIWAIRGKRNKLLFFQTYCAKKKTMFVTKAEHYG